MGGTHGKPNSTCIPGMPEGSSLGGGGCPIKGKGKSSSSPPTPPPPEAPPAAAQFEGGCPIKRAGNKTGTVYNVYAQPIDPTNQMPATANQQKAPGQTQSLSTDRVASHIPKGGTEAETWMYPSPQMFWNALTRKGKAEGAKEEDMEVVVAIHNNMNEKTWHKVMEWEALHASPEGSGGGQQHQQQQQQPVDVTTVDARLSRFLGRPDDISPKAWIKSLFGHPLPFDRHDWVVQRADGTEIRYIIDYYHDDVAAKDNQVPRLHDFESVKSISVDVRPALDSIAAVMDRGVRMPFSRRFAEAKNPFEPLPFFWKGNPVPAGEEEKKKTAAGGKEEKMDLMELSKQVHNSCAEHFVALQSCKDEASCSKAAVGLTYCMASMLCKDEAKAFDAMLEKSAGNDKHQEAIEATFNRMRTCLDDFETKARKSAGKD